MQSGEHPIEQLSIEIRYTKTFKVRITGGTKMSPDESEIRLIRLD